MEFFYQRFFNQISCGVSWVGGVVCLTVILPTGACRPSVTSWSVAGLLGRISIKTKKGISYSLLIRFMLWELHHWIADDFPNRIHVKSTPQNHSRDFYLCFGFAGGCGKFASFSDAVISLTQSPFSPHVGVSLSKNGTRNGFRSCIFCE